MKEDIVKRWVDYWTKYVPNKPWIDKVRYGLQCLKDSYFGGPTGERISNVMWYAMQTYHNLGENK